MKINMDVKKILVSFLAIASILLASSVASAYTVTGDLADIYEVKIDDLGASTNDISVIAGESITAKVYFTASQNATDVRVQLELEGEKEDVDARTDYFDVEAGKSYVKTLVLKVPYELEDDESRDMPLNIKIWNGDYKSEINDIVLRVQRPSYNAEIFSVNTQSKVTAGELFPVDIVIKNSGYNDLNDLTVTVRIDALGLERTSYFGDLVTIADSDNEEADTVKGTIYLRLPYDAEEGKYSLEVEVSNDDTVSSEVKEIIVENEFPEPVIKVEGGLLFVNPTNQLKVYRIVFPSSEQIVAVQAGSSKTVDVSVSAEYLVTVLTMDGEVVGTFTFDGGEPLGAPIVVITVILAIIFLVLLVILIVLLTKKPQKTEEFGESYY